MRRLVAVIAAACATCVVLACVAFALPAQDDAPKETEYGYLYSGAKSESRDFTLAASRDDTYFLLGSSELITGNDMVPTAPGNVLRSYDCGYQFMFVGEAYDQSLWMAIAAGAYAQDMPNKKLGIIVSAQWFTDGGLEPGIFKMRFSYPLYRAFCANDAISDETKQRVAARLAEEGVDASLIDAGLKTSPQDSLNDVVFSAMNDLRIRDNLKSVREGGMPVVHPTEAPDFDALREQAFVLADEACTNNAYHVYDNYWTEFLEPGYESKAGSMAGDTLSDTPEYDDLQCLLDVCRESGLEPMIIMMPVNGDWYDYVGLSPEARAACYARMRALCEQAGVEYLDFSPHEYDPYYLYDIMHFGWLGWLDVEEAFMHFTAEDRL